MGLLPGTKVPRYRAEEATQYQYQYQPGFVGILTALCVEAQLRGFPLHSTPLASLAQDLQCCQALQGGT